MPYKPSDIDRVAELLRQATRIATLSGAGLSKASGIPTYRDSGGLWTQGDNLKYSSIENFQADPSGFLGFWAARRAEVARAQPNPGHVALAEVQDLKPETVHVTQNVDGLLTKAGCKGALELHGNLNRSRCDACQVVIDQEERHPERCPACGGYLRPDVVMFGEQLPARTSADAEWASKRSEVFLLIGTSALVYPAADLPLRAIARGAKLVVINMESTPLDVEADALLRGPSELVLPALVTALRMQ
jgi:NAD-dependent deacetylase